MKKQILIILLLILCRVSFAQNNNGKKIQLQFKERTSFKYADDRYNILNDTIFHANSGFRVYSGYDIDTIRDGIEFIVFQYPNWGKKGGKNQNTKKRLSLKGLFQPYIKIAHLDSVSSLHKDDSIKAKIVKEVTDSLRILVELEKLKKPVHCEIKGKNNINLVMMKDDFDKLVLENKVTDVYSLKEGATKLASGFMTVPFKLRPSKDSINFNMTTDITLGAYLGVKQRISRKSNNYIILPMTLGLSYINVGNNETSNVSTENNSSIVPGWTWSTGLVFDFNGFNVGFVLGQDFASGVGDDWLYNKELWYSFSIGYSFFSKQK